MVAFSHSLTGDGPYPVLKINFGPAGNISLAYSNGGQPNIFEASRYDASILPNLCHKIGSLRIWQGSMMLDLAPLWQRMFQQAMPSGRIVARPVMVNGSPPKNVFDSAPNAGSGFRYVLPKWFNDS